MELKLLSVKDKNMIMEIISEAFSSEPWNDRWDNQTVFEEYINDIVGNNNSLALGMFEGETLIGIAIGRLKHWFNGIEYCIDDLCIKKCCQSKGYGKKLIGMIKEYSVKNGFSRISLKTSKKADAYHFYKNNGFSESENDIYFEMHL